MRAELRHRIIAKYKDHLERLVFYLLPGKPKEDQIWRRVAGGLVSKKLMDVYETSLKGMPDDRFDALMAELDSSDPVELMRKNFAGALAHLPKKRGGRKGTFSLAVRQRAIQDIGHEYPRCDSLAEAIEVVAARYGMTTDYLRKVWKNRKRLRGNERKDSQK